MKIELSTENDAFAGLSFEFEVVRILEEVIQKIKEGGRSGLVFDINGNRVGKWEL